MLFGSWVGTVYGLFCKFNPLKNGPQVRDNYKGLDLTGYIYPHDTLLSRTEGKKPDQMGGFEECGVFAMGCPTTHHS